MSDQQPVPEATPAPPAQPVVNPHGRKSAAAPHPGSTAAAMMAAQGRPESERLAEDFGIGMNIEAAALPSRGVFYPPGHPWHRRPFVDLRAMTAKDENILTNQSFITDGTMIDRLLQSCLISKPQDIGSVLLGDRNALLFQLRMYSYGPEYRVSINCPACRATNHVEAQLNELEMIGPGDDDFPPAQQEGSPHFEFELPILKRRVSFRLPTVADERDISIQERRAEALKGRKKVAALAPSANQITNRLNMFLTGVEGKNGEWVTDRGMIRRFVQAIPAGDSSKLRSYMDRCEPRIDLDWPFQCEKCGHMGGVKLPLAASFFFPES